MYCHQFLALIWHNMSVMVTCRQNVTLTCRRHDPNVRGKYRPICHVIIWASVTGDIVRWNFESITVMALALSMFWAWLWLLHHYKSQRVLLRCIYIKITLMLSHYLLLHLNHHNHHHHYEQLAAYGHIQVMRHSQLSASLPSASKVDKHSL